MAYATARAAVNAAFASPRYEQFLQDTAELFRVNHWTWSGYLLSLVDIGQTLRSLARATLAELGPGQHMASSSGRLQVRVDCYTPEVGWTCTLEVVPRWLVA